MRFTFLIFFLLSGSLFCTRPALGQADSVRVNPPVPDALISSAQRPAVANWGWYVKFSPQHLLMNGYNLEVERRLSAGGNHSITVSPRFFNGGTGTIDKLSGREEDSENSEVKGYGAEIMHRVYYKNPLVKNGLQYFAYGVNYHHFNLNYETLGWAEVETGDGLKYYLYQWHPGNEKVGRFGLLAVSGVQSAFIANRLIADFYGGLGYRFSKSSNPQGTRYDTNIFDYGSTGLYLTMGLKLGYSF